MKRDMEAFFAGELRTDKLLKAHGVKRFVDVIQRVHQHAGPTPWVEAEDEEDEALASILADEEEESDGAIARILGIDAPQEDLAPLRAEIREAAEQVASAKERKREAEQGWSAQWEDKADAKTALQDAECKLFILEKNNK